MSFFLMFEQLVQHETEMKDFYKHFHYSLSYFSLVLQNIHINKIIFVSKGVRQSTYQCKMYFFQIKSEKYIKHREILLFSEKDLQITKLENKIYRKMYIVKFLDQF